MGCPSGQEQGAGGYCKPVGYTQCSSDLSLSCPSGHSCGVGGFCIPYGKLQCGTSGSTCPIGYKCTGSGTSWTCPFECSGATQTSDLTSTQVCSGSSCYSVLPNASTTYRCPVTPSPPTPSPPTPSPPTPSPPTPGADALLLAQNPIINTPSPTPAPASGSLSPAPLSAPAPAPVDAPITYTPPDEPVATDDFWSIMFLNLNIKWWLVIGGIVLFLLFVLLLI